MSNRVEKILKYGLFPLVLLLYPLLNFDTGVDLTDTGYSLAGFVFFPVHPDNAAVSGLFLNTYLSNVVGFLLTKLPFGGLMLGMNFYTSLIVSAIALLGYRFYITKMPAWIAFVSQLLALSLCWCPTVVLYNYLTYLLFLLGAIFLFRGLVGYKTSWLVAAGACLGLNVFVRTPNLLEASLIFCLWYYAWLRHKKMKVVVRETLLCLAGYVGAVVLVGVVMMIHLGANAPLEMIEGLFQMSASNSRYTFARMIETIFDAYIFGGKWLLIMAFCVLPGLPFMRMRLGGELPKKIAYCLAIVFLFYAFSRIGMYNFTYYQKDSALCWALVFILLSLTSMVWMLFSHQIDVHWKLLAAMGIVVIIVTPLGSNSDLWPVINNLFFVAPITIWHIYKLVRFTPPLVGPASFRVPLFPLKAMLAAIVVAVGVQSLGVGIFHVYRDGEDGEARNTRIAGNDVLRGMRTTAANAAALREITAFAQPYPADTDLILFGNIPSLSYYLNRPSALSSPWPILDSFDPQQFGRELDDMAGWVDIKGKTRPLIILATELPSWATVADKQAALEAFMAKQGYNEVFRNEAFIAYY
ncbi:MAG: hypothetical protein LBI54_00310 [Lachnospiraceae bacterium]|nr:hypothetical protein [Lachnospiraceae bacterium]